MFAALRPTVPGTPYERGVVALAAQRPEDALVEFASALDSGGTVIDRARAHNKTGVALVALGRRDEAIEAFCRALEVDERLADALVNIGTLLLEDGHVADAVDYYEGAIRIDESCALAYRNLSVALRRLGRRPEAVRALRTAVRLSNRRSRGRA